MMQVKSISFIAAAALAATAFAASAQQPAAPAAAPAGSKLGYVDTERVMREARVPRELKASLEAEFRKREREIASAPAADADRRRAALADDMSAKRDEATKVLIDKANRIIKRIAEAEKFDAVFIEAAYASARIDITEKVIKALDAER